MSVSGRRRGPASFAQARDGNVIITFALLLPVALILLGGGVDYARWLSNTTDLQNAADTAALAGARELRLANANSTAVVAAARNRALADIGTQAADAVVNAQVVGSNAVQVDIDVTSQSLFSWAPAKFSHLHAHALAQTASTPTCILALNAGGNGLRLDTAAIVANGCAVYSNAQKSDGLKVSKSTVAAIQSCSAGGAQLNLGVVLPLPVTDCPVISDPLASRAPPTFGACDHNQMVVSQGAASLSPGVYCGGLKITDGATVSLSPGVYVIEGGQLSVDKAATLKGNEVGFYLAGAQAVLNLDPLSNINLVAPKDGALAGILFFEDPSAPAGRQHTIGSRNAPQLLGTLYFPRGVLNFGTPLANLVGQAVADATTCLKLGIVYPCIVPQVSLAVLSAWTIVIASEININLNVSLVLNSNYSSSSTPPPAEFGFKGASLSQ